MNRAIVVLMSAAVFCLSVLGSPRAATFKQTDYVLRVTSVVPGKEVKFRGAIVFKAPGAPLQLLTKRTPFELRSTGTGASGVFKAVEEGVKIMVELTADEVKGKRGAVKGTGTTVIVGDKVGDESAIFVTFLEL